MPILTPHKSVWTPRRRRHAGGFFTHPWCCCGTTPEDETCADSEAKVTLTGITACTICHDLGSTSSRFVNHDTIDGTYTLVWNGSTKWTFSDAGVTVDEESYLSVDDCSGAPTFTLPATTLTLELFQSSGLLTVNWPGTGVSSFTFNLAGLPETIGPDGGGVVCAAFSDPAYTDVGSTAKLGCADDT